MSPPPPDAGSHLNERIEKMGKPRTITTAAAVGLAVGLGTGALVPRINEVGRMSSLLNASSTLAYGQLHVTVGELREGEPGVMVTAPLTHLVGLEHALLHDADYQRALRWGLEGGELYDRDGMPRGRLRAVVPVPHNPDLLLVAIEGGRWVHLHRSDWHRLGGAL